jgi:hypothetical protein
LFAGAFITMHMWPSPFVMAPILAGTVSMFLLHAYAIPLVPRGA